MACPCMHSLTQHGAQSCSPAVCILHGAARRHAACQSVTGTFLESDLAETLSAGGSHTSLSLPSSLSQVPPPAPASTDLLERGTIISTFIQGATPIPLRPVRPCPSHFCPSSLGERVTGARRKGGSGVDGVELKLMTVTSLPQAPGPSPPARTRVGVSALKRS